ncbi:hypothetical protein IMF23_00080 [Chelatococcus daeguensis]|uniref:Uncharacterized protein n=1 Tax=Chelatococcus sambhunathii TaxID=363953 RepID=A0ABM9UDS2_9HYPH|nr:MULTISPECIES: hypothetical protein [Chelatococcus]KZE34138.1 hypothetical protein AVW15_17645 [Chelatococcus daeguensis]MBM3081826.1 hypothetical protein [Chelatococcus daeguensis]CUA90853.1 hypothetical protein Ga0061061_11614 [Chelatococcus sambhunathii]
MFRLKILSGPGPSGLYSRPCFLRAIEPGGVVTTHNPRAAKPFADPAEAVVYGSPIARTYRLCIEPIPPGESGYSEQMIAEILVESGCDLADDEACIEALVARGIRPSEIVCDWHSAKTRAFDALHPTERA